MKNPANDKEDMNIRQYGILISHRGNLIRHFEAYEKTVEKKEVPGGGWCKSCQSYNCGHFLDAHGDVIIDGKTGEAKAAPKDKKLREVLPHEFFDSFMASRAAKFLDIGVILEKDAREEKWPGKEKNVTYFWILENGYLVGWNENPSRGWSFPVVRDPVQMPKLTKASV